METDDITLLRSTMERTVDDLPPLPDLAPLAAREGRRRRLRARVAIVTTAFGAVTAGALGLTLLPGSSPAVTMPAAVPSSPGATASASTGPSTTYAPVTIEETPGVTPPDNPDGLSEAERARHAAHQQRVAALLDELLPATVTEIRPVKDKVYVYRIASGGETFRMTVSVRPSDENRLKPCVDDPVRGFHCEKVTFDGNREAQLVSMLVNGDETSGSYLDFRYGDSRVQLSVDPERVSAPVTPRQLLAVAQDPRFLDLVRYADENPVETKAPPAVEGG
ncbi:hypothetical protein ABT034_25585 [Streptomyces sp. NPDC002773]|uniref:hypothetical protein n=1 Tax=Streptomyces sp. NPDC002773 TaxID=3154430 RepID=UPI00331D9D47